MQTVLVLAPHTDDGEFGCGGTVAKLVRSGSRVIYVAFSAAEQSVLPHYPRDILRKEVVLATTQLGIKHIDCLVLDFEVRRFPERRQDILDMMINLNRQYQPDIVFLPTPNDTHQDHQVIAQEGFRAFKKITMLGYEIPWNNLDFRTSCFVKLEEEDFNRKIESLNKYESQKHRSYASFEYIRAQAIMRGTQIGVKYAEAFEAIRWIF